MIRIPELGKPEESGRLPGSVVGTVNGHGGEDLQGEAVHAVRLTK
jgi:hypothetical protein